MKQIQNISADAVQTHLILFDESEIVLKLRFFELTGHWSMNVEFKGKVVQGIKLSLGVLHLQSANLPFDFMVESDLGMDPYLAEAFVKNHCRLYLLEKAEMTQIRGTSVEV